MKKLLMSALLILMMFALVGCGEKAGGDSEKKDDSDSSSSNNFKGTTWVWEDSYYDEDSGEEVDYELIIKFVTASSGTITESEYIDSELEEEYESDFEYTVESSTTCIISLEDEDIELKGKIDGTKLKLYQDGELGYIFKKK